MIGWQEIILILAILLIVFGPAKLPKLARELGKAWNTIVKASSGLIEPGGSGQTTENNYRDKLLSEVAKKLQINTQGKATNQLSKEILTKVLNTEEESTSNKG